MKVLYYKETKKFVSIRFTNTTNGIMNIKSIYTVDNLWEATIFSKPNAVAVFNVIYKHSCYELSIVQITNNVL